MENLPTTPEHDDHDDVDHDGDVDHDHDHDEYDDHDEYVDHDEDNDHHEDDHDPEEDDHDDEDLGQVSLSSSSPLIALVSDTKVGLSATLASLSVITITKRHLFKQTMSPISICFE